MPLNIVPLRCPLAVRKAGDEAARRLSKHARINVQGCGFRYLGRAMSYYIIYIYVSMQRRGAICNI